MGLIPPRCRRLRSSHRHARVIGEGSATRINAGSSKRRRSQTPASPRSHGAMASPAVFCVDGSRSWECLVFIDETGAATDMSRRYGRCPRGHPGSSAQSIPTACLSDRWRSAASLAASSSASNVGSRRWSDAHESRQSGFGNPSQALFREEGDLQPRYMLVSETSLFTRLGPRSCQTSRKNTLIAATL
jgi:hypothetical protein